MSHCIDKIVTLGVCPDDGAPTSGFSLIHAPGISMSNLANVATDAYVTGTTLAMEKKKLTKAQIVNDFIGAIQSMNVVARTVDQLYPTTRLSNISSGLNSLPRGVEIHAVKHRPGLRRLVVESVDLLPLDTGTTTLLIGDKSFSIDVEAGGINTFNESNLPEAFPFVTAESRLKIRVDQSVIPFGSGEITCMQGCHGRAPNPCAWADGWNGNANVKAEGYGVNVNFKCTCDYEALLCDNRLTGELFYTRWQINIFEEQVLSNRFESWVTHNREMLTKEILPTLWGKYHDLWAAFVKGLPDLLRSYNDDCLDCRRIRRVVNI